jgi:monofunctional biosynthetic peptidoglycan transglycosylase
MLLNNYSAPRNLFKALAALIAAAGLASAAYIFWLPEVSSLKKKNPAVTSYMLIKEGQAAASGKKPARDMVWTSWNDISENLKHAVLVAEDDTFYRHKGVEWESMRRALKTDWKTRSLAKGGSTITQQLARNLYLSPSKNPLRKIKEILIARKLERALGKRRIFELYLNIAEWGKGIYGAQAAARAYFGKNASELNPEEAAALAAILPSPRRYNPTKGTRFIEKRKNQIVARMRASGYLPEEAEEANLDETLEAITASTETITAPQDPANPVLTNSPSPVDTSTATPIAGSH